MFRVTWIPLVARTIELWVEELEEDEVAGLVEAIGRIDERLQTDPDGEGESRELGRRFLYEPPPGITFQVDHEQNTVWVLRAWRVGRN